MFAAFAMNAQTVVQVIIDSPDHGTLETAVIAAELDDDLSGAGPFTVFAPTDDAFNNLPMGVLDALLADPTGALADVLLYHVASGAVLSGALSDGQMVPTLFGQDVTVTIVGGNVMINDAMVTVADIEADNGVVHVIDAVLVPATLPATVVDIIVGSPVHETLEVAVIAADLAGTLSGAGPFTVFAPTDDAFANLPMGVLDALLADPTGALADVLLYHVVSGAVLSGTLTDGQIVPTLFGQDVTVTIVDGNVMINDAMVTVADIEAENGVVHVIDAVLVPATLPATVVDIIVGSPVHETLEVAVIAADLAGTLSGAGPFTVFAPTDDAFANLPMGVLDALLADPTGALADVLLYHVVSGAVLSGTLTDGQIVPTLFGQDVTVTIVDGNVMINDAMVTVADIEAENGVVHVIDAVLVPATLPATVVDIIVGSPVHETLEAAVIAADLAGTLSGAGPFTVFAPTDDAFANLPTGLLDALLMDPTGVLADILLNHVATGATFAADLSDGQMIPTLFGQNLMVTIADGVVMINDATVIIADLEAENGVVHVIDVVLVPVEFPGTVVDIIVGSPVHETLEVAVIAAGLVDALSGDGPFTVFAPTDDAFANLPMGVLDALLADPTGALADVLLYHVANGTSLAADLSDGQLVPTLFGQDVTVTIVDGNVMINDAMVLVADLQAENGVVHVIDAVLVPATLPATVVDIIVASPVHTILETAVIAADLAGALSGDGPFTVFAPTDDAFELLADGVLDALLDDPTGALASILLYHVAAGATFSGDLSDGDAIETLFNMEDVIVTIVDGNVMINDAMVIIADLEAENGVVHVINAVLLPPTNVEAVNIDAISIYPNPAQNVINISGDVPAGTQYTIIDQAGRVIATNTFTGVTRIDVSGFEAGVYSFIIVGDNTLTAKQFVVN